MLACSQELQALFGKLDSVGDQIAEFEEFVFIADQDRAHELVAVHDAFFVITL
ncbi:hypothetical protein D3C87_2109450 [compost metagenome]